MSVFDLLLTQAIMEGLAREAAREKLPENVFVLQRSPLSWKAVKELCEKDNHVVAVEITEDKNPNCLRMQKVFVNIAREFGGIGFFRASIEDGFTFPEVRVTYQKRRNLNKIGGGGGGGGGAQRVCPI